MSSMFFMRVMTSSCCPGTARLPVCRGVDGVADACCCDCAADCDADCDCATAGVVGAEGVAAMEEIGGLDYILSCTFSEL